MAQNSFKDPICLRGNTSSDDIVLKNYNGELYVNNSPIGNSLIISQDLNAEDFTPTANTYYLHTGATSTNFVNGGIYYYDGSSYGLCGDHPLRIIKGGDSQANAISIFSLYDNVVGVVSRKRGVAFCEGFFTDLPSVMSPIFSQSFFIEFETVPATPATLTITYKGIIYISEYNSSLLSWGDWEENVTVTPAEKTQISTNATDIAALQASKLDKKPDGTTDLIDSNNKINIPYLPDFVIGQMLNAGVITSLDGETATAELTTGGKSKLGVSSNVLTLTNDTTAPTGYLANENNYYIIGDNTGIKDGEVLRDNNLNLLKNTYNGYLTPDYVYYHGVTASKGQGTGTILLNGTADGSGAYTINLGHINIVNGTTYTLSLYSEIPSGVSGSYVILLLRDSDTVVAQTNARDLTISFVATADINNAEIILFYYGGQTYDNYLVKPAIYEGDLTVNMPEYQPYLSMFAGLYFEVGDWLVATASGWAKIDNVDAVKSVNGKTGFVQLQIADIPNLQDTLDDKTDKVSGAISGNFAGLDGNGNLTDSGKKASDFQSVLTAGNGITIDGNVISASSGGNVKTNSLTIDTPVWTNQPTIEGTLDSSFLVYTAQYYFVTLKDTDGTALPSGQFKLSLTQDGFATAINQIFTLTDYDTGNSGILAENSIVDFKTISNDRTSFEMRDDVITTSNLQYFNLLADESVVISGKVKIQKTAIYPYTQTVGQARGQLFVATNGSQGCVSLIEGYYRPAFGGADLYTGVSSQNKFSSTNRFCYLFETVEINVNKGIWEINSNSSLVYTPSNFDPYGSGGAFITQYNKQGYVVSRNLDGEFPIARYCLSQFGSMYRNGTSVYIEVEENA